MKLAILTDDRASFRKPMAEGLAALLARADCETKVFYDGLRWLDFDPPPWRESLRGGVVQGIRAAVRRLRAARFVARMGRYDAVVVVANTPPAFRRDRYPGIDAIRARHRIPVVLYQNYYLLTNGRWYTQLKDGFERPDGRRLAPSQHGLDRYDYYLAASTVSEAALPRTPQPLAVVGLNLPRETLYPEQDEFVALLDFRRPEFEQERALQIDVLEETGTKWIELHGSYSLAEIHAIYRKAAIFFLSFRESFGLPICELQLCGSLVAAPHRYWVPAFYLKDPHAEGEGELSGNFLIYDNDREKLRERIAHARENFDPARVVRNFAASYPHLHGGDMTEIIRFRDLLRDGTITPEYHLQHARLEAEHRYSESAELRSYHRRLGL